MKVACSARFIWTDNWRTVDECATESPEQNSWDYEFRVIHSLELVTLASRDNLICPNILHLFRGRTGDSYFFQGD